VEIVRRCGRIVVCAALVTALVACAWAARAAACPTADITQAADAVDKARAALLALPVGDGLQTSVSQEARRAIAAMQASLADLANAHMACAPLNEAPETIERDLSRLVHAFALEDRVYRNEELPKEAGHYGFELTFTAKAWSDHPGVIGIVADFSIECGSDAVLLVFAPSGTRWKEALRWQSKPYAEVSGALGSFGYAVSPADSRGRWYVVVKSIAPWCSSTWSLIRYAVLRPVAGRVRPTTIYAGEDSIWWGSEDFGRLTVGQDEFELRFHADSIDMGVHNRIWIRHFRIVADSVARIAPVALSPRDFADEWIVSRWQEASQWSAADARRTLELQHEQLNKIHYFTYDSVRRCSDRPDHYQVALLDEDDQTRYYLHIVGETDYRATAVSASPDASCSGEDVSGTMGTP
jgi:hypothetical protein